MGGTFAVYVWHAIEDVPKLVTLKEYKEKYGGSDHTTVRMFIRHDDPDYDEPKMISVFYPCGKFFMSQVKHLDGTPASYYGYGNGVYGDQFGGRWRLLDGGATVPDKEMTIIAEIPRPKKKEVRYRWGKWEYWTKTHGWKSC